MKRTILFTALVLSSYAAHATSPGSNQAQPFAQPSVSHMKKFARPREKMFVYERFDAEGALYQREMKPIISPVEVASATRRIINGTAYRLRGLISCPKPRIAYKKEEWDCTKAAQNYGGTIYNKRASVVLCKTLVLKSRPGVPDAASCFALVGAGNADDPYSVSYDDDSMVFFGMAAIGRNKDGKSLRPDLEHAADLGKQFR